MNKVKKHTTILEQIEILKARGLTINSNQEAEYFLHLISYYSLTSYRFPFTDNNNNKHYKEGTKFIDLVNLYYKDLEYKTCLYQLLQHIEVTFKTQIINQLAKENIEFYITDMKQCESEAKKDLEICCTTNSIEYSNISQTLNTYTGTKKLLSKELPKLYKKHNDIRNKVVRVRQCIKNSHSIYIKNFHKQKQGQNQYPEAWIALEAFDFGQLIDAYTYSKLEEEKQRIAQFFNTDNAETLTRCLRDIKRIRNIISHHDKVLDRMEYQKSEVIKFLTNKYTNKEIDELLGKHEKTFLPYFLLIKYLMEQILSCNTFNEYMRTTYSNFLNMSKDNQQYLHLFNLADNYFE